MPGMVFSLRELSTIMAGGEMFHDGKNSIGTPTPQMHGSFLLPTLKCVKHFAAPPISSNIAIDNAHTVPQRALLSMSLIQSDNADGFEYSATLT